MHSFMALSEVLMAVFSLTRSGSWNWESAAFSDPARSMTKSLPSSAVLKSGTRSLSRFRNRDAIENF